MVRSFQAVDVARRLRPRTHGAITPVPTGSASQMPSAPQPAAAHAAELTPPLHAPAHQAQRLPAADGSRGGGGGALSGFDKFLVSLSQQTAAQHLQPAVREAYRSLDEQRHKLVTNAA